MLQKINRGDVYFYDFGHEYDGSVQGKNRPCVVISNNKGNSFGTTAIVAPITTRNKEQCKPWQVYYSVDGRGQIILLEQIKTVAINKLTRYQGRLDSITMLAVDKALAIEFELNIAEKELQANEFLHRLDDILTKVTHKHLCTYESKINELITKTITETFIQKQEFEKIQDVIIEKITKILDSTNCAYQKLIDIPNTLKKEKDIDFKNKSKKSRYTVEFAKQFIDDYYNGDRQLFIDKYNLHEVTTINNRLTTMKNLLKRNGINWLDIRDRVKVYKLNEMSEEEQIKTFGKVIETNNLSNNDTIKKSLELEEYRLQNTSDYKCGNGQNKRNKQSVRIEPFKYTVENCLAFVDECNKNSAEDMCKLHNLTSKQFANRKYLICKWLKEHNITFNIVKYKRV